MMEETLAQQAKQFDFVRLTTVDLFGRSRGKLVPASQLPGILKKGHTVVSGFGLCGPRQELPTIPEFEEMGFCNGFWKPEEDTIYEIPWSTSTYRLGEVLCGTYHSSGESEDWGPRHILQKQLQSLKREGLLVKSAFEFEFTMHDKETQEPIYETNEFVSPTILSKYEQLLCSISSHVAGFGCMVEKFENEWAPAQFEFSFEPEFGMKTADNMFRFRQAVREISQQHNLVPTFMAIPYFKNNCSNGFHFNVSLWSAEDSTVNALYAAGKSGLSELGQFFLGGLINHMDAMMSILCPTINCYRRLGNLFVRNAKDWCYDKRVGSFRVVRESNSGTRIEVRVVSSIANPYLVMAAIIAAGVDGIKNKILPPDEGPRDVRTVDSLAGALDALEADQVMRESLGEQFVRFWTHVKRDFEVKPMGHHNMKENDLEELKKEKDMYFYV